MSALMSHLAANVQTIQFNGNAVGNTTFETLLIRLEMKSIFFSTLSEAINLDERNSSESLASH